MLVSDNITKLRTCHLHKCGCRLLYRKVVLKKIRLLEYLYARTELLTKFYLIHAAFEDSTLQTFFTVIRLDN